MRCRSSTSSTCSSISSSSERWATRRPRPSKRAATPTTEPSIAHHVNAWPDIDLRRPLPVAQQNLVQHPGRFALAEEEIAQRLLHQVLAAESEVDTDRI